MGIRKFMQTIFGANLEANFADKQVQQVVFCLIIADEKDLSIICWK